MNDFVMFLADCGLKSSVVLCVALAVTFVLRNRSASLRHSIWSACVAAVVLMPALTILLPTWKEDFTIATMTRFSPPLKRIATSDQVFGGIVEASGTTTANPDRASLVVLAWISGFFSIAAIVVRESVGLARVAWSAAPFFDSRWFRMTTELRQRFHLKRSVRFVQSSSASMLVTWGAIRPQVLLPSGADTWTDRRMRAVLGHELAHIRRYDWFVQLIGEIARAIYWFNPLVWLACGRLRQESERACDDVVLGLGVESTEYATELLELARMLKTSGCSWAPSLAMAHASTLERRFAAMLNPSADHQPISGKVMLLIGILALCLTLPVAAMRAPLQSPAGRLFGRVYDPNGAPIKNAAISVFDPVTNFRDITTSNANGVFEFTRLPAGQYELQTAATGFEAFEIDSVGVEANQEVNLNILTVAAAVPAPAKAALTQSRAQLANSNQLPRLIHQVPPVYPPNSKNERVQGAVVLDAVIGTDGVPKSLRVVSADIDPDLAKAAVEAVKQWRYQPATQNGQPVEAAMSMTVNFTLAAGIRPQMAVGGVAAGTTPPPPPATATSQLTVLTDPPTTLPPPPTRIRQGGNVQQSMILAQVKPVYPPDAKEAGIQGVVILEAVIGKAGDVENVQVVSGHPLLQQAAVDAVSQWKYRPTLLNGQPVEVVTAVTVNFALQQ